MKRQLLKPASFDTASLKSRMVYILILLLSAQFIRVEIASSQQASTELLTEQQAIAAKIERSLNSNPMFLERGIQVAVVNGVAHVTGILENLNEKQQILDLTRQAPGVLGVIDRLEVHPISRPDEDIRKDIVASFIENTTVDHYEVVVSVSQGIVTLIGEVNSWQERRLAEIITRKIPGVSAIRNQLVVTARQPRSDSEILSDILGILKADARLKGNPIRVTVDDGVVILEGTVETLEERNWVIQNAFTPGVSSVDASRLVTSDPRAADTAMVARSQGPDANEIVNAIRAVLAQDPVLVGSTLDVTYDRGIATLNGNVETMVARQAAEQDARNTIGVGTVLNLIEVRPPGGIPSDVDLASKVLQALRRIPELKENEIQVNVIEGLVTLAGRVNSANTRQLVENVTASLFGVAQVRNQIEVGPPESTLRNLTVDERRNLTREDDLRTREKILDELYWTPEVDEDNVQVQVENGVAVLSGVVGSRKESYAAERNAFEGGAQRVVNNLRIRQF